MVEKEKEIELKKHVGAIHSSNGVSLLQRKIANGLLFNAYDELLQKDEYKITIRELCELIGYDSNDIKTIKVALKRLLSTVIEWNLVDKESLEKHEIWNASSIISDVSIENSICTYSYSNKMKQLLYHPAVYGRLNMETQAKFRSSYGLALYENCIRYQNLPQTPWFDYLVFRNLMGVGEGKYSRFVDFKNRVLKVGIKEVNLYSKISVYPEIRYKNKEVDAIRFLIKPCLEISSPDLIAIAQPTSNSDCAQKLSEDFGMSNIQLSEVIARYDDKYIIEKMNIIEASPSFIDGKIKNLAKYLQLALEHDYQLPKSSKEKLVERKIQKDKIEELKKNITSQEDRLKKAYRKYQMDGVKNNLYALDEDDQNKMLTEFENSLDSELYVKLFKKNGLENILIFEKFLVFAKEKDFDLVKNLMSFADYRKTITF